MERFRDYMLGHEHEEISIDLDKFLAISHFQIAGYL